jgi:CubicO group peptidase (beta-lactamase class C family)
VRSRRRLAAIALTWLAAASSPAQRLVAAPQPADPPLARAAEQLEALRSATGVPSLAVAVALDQRIVFSDAVGYADLESLAPARPSTVYGIGSISKVMTVVAVMQLVEQDKVGLDDPIQRYVPSFPDRGPDESPDRGKPITIWNLLTHTSGIRHYAPDDFPGEAWSQNVADYPTFEEAIGIFRDDPLLFEPGAYFLYSSYAVNLLQGVVETASGLAFEDYLRRHVWAPAGMLSTAFDRPRRIVPRRARGYAIVDGEWVRDYPDENVTYKFASGGMLSTVEDLVRFGVAVNGARLLGRETTERMLAPQLHGTREFNGAGPPLEMRWEQALLWRIRRDELDRPYINHCGTVKGFNACLILYRDEDLVVAIADNGSGGAADLKGARGFAELFRPRAREDPSEASSEPADARSGVDRPRTPVDRLGTPQ